MSQPTAKNSHALDSRVRPACEMLGQWIGQDSNLLTPTAWRQTQSAASVFRGTTSQPRRRSKNLDSPSGHAWLYTPAFGSRLSAMSRSFSVDPHDYPHADTSRKEHSRECLLFVDYKSFRSSLLNRELGCDFPLLDFFKSGSKYSFDLRRAFGMISSAALSFGNFSARGSSTWKMFA